MFLKNKQNDIKITPSQIFLSSLVANTIPMQKFAGELESKFLHLELNKVQINKPVYITSFCRSGTTILLHIINEHKDTASFRYKDYPFIFTPCIWEFILENFQKNQHVPEERSHKDRLFVTPNSPEAFEEILWMSFFPDIHNESKSNILNQKHNSKEFNNFYLNTIKKLLLSRRKSRYLAKGNYNLSRLEYIQNLMPSSKFIIPVRNPVDHIASLIKQHKFFTEQQSLNPNLLKYFDHSGHFEFGLNRKIINLGNHNIVSIIKEEWQKGNEIKGWAIYWNEIFKYVVEVLMKNANLDENVLFVQYEHLCKHPKETIQNILNFCDLDNSKFDFEKFEDKIKLPDYYKYEFSVEDLRTIESCTEESKTMLTKKL